MFTIVRSAATPPLSSPAISTTYHLQGPTNWTHCGVWPDGVRHTDQPAAVVRGMHQLSAEARNGTVCPTCLIAAHQSGPRCDFEIWDGNSDDPSYAYCGHPAGHAGDHGEWKA